VLLSTGGIVPTRRVRSRLSLSLQEREEVSRGLVAGLSMRKIAVQLGRSTSTIILQRPGMTGDLFVFF
jgi:DNA-binding CsgD family transcriptional regulator